MAKLGRNKEAINVAQAALDVAPEDAWINYLYGRLLIVKQRDKALKYWERAMKLNPNYNDCAASLGHERLRDRMFAEANRLLSLSTKGDPSNGRAWMDLADVRIELHDFNGARTALEGAGSAMFAASKDVIDSRLKLIQTREGQTKLK